MNTNSGTYNTFRDYVRTHTSPPQSSFDPNTAGACVRKTKDDRRFAIFYTAQQSMADIVKDGMGGNYFPELYNWLKRDGYAIVTDYLKNYSIPVELNPAGECQQDMIFNPAIG